MASVGKGLICTPMNAEYAKKLGFAPMVAENTDNHETAFTVSVDWAGTTTGISAEERGMTARHIVEDNAKPEDFRRPGHMFPLIAKKNGVLERGGHTEATVDLMRLAGLKECGLCCEIMRDDGTMMRTTELAGLASRLRLPMISNQKVNSYLKVIRDICGIDKPIFSHVARHTYATRCLNRGIRLEVVAVARRLAVSIIRQ